MDARKMPSARSPSPTSSWCCALRTPPLRVRFFTREGTRGRSGRFLRRFAMRRHSPPGGGVLLVRCERDAPAAPAPKPAEAGADGVSHVAVVQVECPDHGDERTILQGRPLLLVATGE